MKTKPATIIGHQPPSLRATLMSIRENAAQQEALARTERLEAERAIERLGKGTRDIPELMPAHPPLPRSHYWIGDETSTDELKATILRVIQHDPTGTPFQQIIAMTGARGNRVSGAIVKLQRDGHRIKNLGDQRTARWWAPTPSRAGRRSTR